MIYQIRKLSAGVINRQYFPSVTGDDRWDVATVKNLYASRSAWYWSEERMCTLLTKSVIGLGAAFPLSLMMKRSSWRKISQWGWKAHRCHCRVIITPSCDWFFFFFFLILSVESGTSRQWFSFSQWRRFSAARLAPYLVDMNNIIFFDCSAAREPVAKDSLLSETLLVLAAGVLAHFALSLFLKTINSQPAPKQKRLWLFGKKKKCSSVSLLFSLLGLLLWQAEG